jgi:glycosyltransferase involved in cell wall biosynthesis
MIRRHRALLPWMPMAVEQHDLRGFDLVISSHHTAAKGVLTRADQLHVCYVHSPMRWAWDLAQEHRPPRKWGPRGWYQSRLLHRLRQWDVVTANRPDAYLANSRTVARRVRKHYRRDARVIHPPVEVARFAAAADRLAGDLPPVEQRPYVAAGRLVGYKRAELIVEAFNGMPERQLIVIGDGPQRRRLQRLAGPNVQLLGRVDDDQMTHRIAGARALVYAADEDFGLLPVEAMAAGVPVVGLNLGGVAETVEHGVSGVLYDEPTPEAIRGAVRELAQTRTGYHADAIRRSAERFEPARFAQQVQEAVHDAWITFRR